MESNLLLQRNLEDLKRFPIYDPGNAFVYRYCKDTYLSYYMHHM